MKEETIDRVVNWTALVKAKYSEVSDTSSHCKSSYRTAKYIRGAIAPRYPMPAIPFVFQWDYSLGLMLDTYSMSDEEWDREEQEWQDHLDKLDGLI